MASFEDRYAPLLARRIRREAIVLGRAYVIHARSLLADDALRLSPEQTAKVINRDVGSFGRQVGGSTWLAPGQTLISRRTRERELVQVRVSRLDVLSANSCAGVEQAGHTAPDLELLLG